MDAREVAEYLLSLCLPSDGVMPSDYDLFDGYLEEEFLSIGRDYDDAVVEGAIPLDPGEVEARASRRYLQYYGADPDAARRAGEWLRELVELLNTQAACAVEADVEYRDFVLAKQARLAAERLPVRSSSSAPVARSSRARRGRARRGRRGGGGPRQGTRARAGPSSSDSDSDPPGLALALPVGAGAVVRSTGLVLPPDLGPEAWREVGRGLKRIRSALSWWLGDWVRFGKRVYGETYEEAMELSGRSYQTVANAAWVAGRIELSRRRENLTFAHHDVVAALAPAEQEKWLERAEAEGWASKELRERVRGRLVEEVVGADDGDEETARWVGMPFFRAVDEPYRTVVEHGSEEEQDRFLERNGLETVHKRTGRTVSVRWPDRPREDLASLRFVGERLPRYPVYVPTKGRWRTPLTIRFLRRDGVPFRAVVEPSEYEDYLPVVGSPDRLLVLPDDDFGLTNARNWIRDHAEAEGHARHWQCDDNIGQVRRLYGGKRIPCDSGPALATVEDLAERYENVGVAGLNYQMFGFPWVGPLQVNCHVYSATLVSHEMPCRWEPFYNEDTDLCLQALANGWCTVLVNAFLIDKKTTMTMAGGNTPLYERGGRLEQALTPQRDWPGVAGVTRRYGRVSHFVDWRRFRNYPRLRLRPGLDLSELPDVDEHMTLKAVRPLRSPELRRLLEEFPS